MTNNYDTFEFEDFSKSVYIIIEYTSSLSENVNLDSSFHFFAPLVLSRKKSIFEFMKI